MSTVTAEKGSKVKVAFEGEVTFENDYEIVVKERNGLEHYLPKNSGAKVEVTEKPLPPEPPVGTVVKDSLGCCVYMRSYDGWHLTRDAKSFPRAWSEVVKASRDVGGEVRVLAENPARAEGAVNLRNEGGVTVTDPNKNRDYSVYWKGILGGRIVFEETNGREVFRLDVDGARKLANTILATLNNV